MKTDPNEQFHAGQRHERALLAVNLLNGYAGDKLAFLQEEMFQKAAVSPDPEWQAYAEGVRQALNVLHYCGDPAEAYAGILNRTFDVRTMAKGPKGSLPPRA